MKKQNQKTAVVTIDYPPNTGGIAVYWSELAKRLGEYLYVIAPSVAQTSDTTAIRVPFFYTRLWPHWLCLINSIRKLPIKPQKILAAQVLPIATVAYILRLLGVIQGYIVSCHGMDIEILVGFKKHLAWFLLHQSDFVLANSQFTKEILIHTYGLNTEKVHIVYPGIDLPKYNTDFNVHKKTKLHLLSVGRLVRRKGFDMVLKSLEKLYANGFECVYDIVGEGADREYLQQIVSTLPKKIQENVYFHGRVSEEQKYDFYKQADIFVMPSRAINGDVEGFGIVNIEAGYFNLPVIAGNVGGVSESVKDGVTGILIDGEDLDAVGDALLGLARDPLLRKKFGEAGRLHALQFTWEKSAESLQKLL